MTDSFLTPPREQLHWIAWDMDGTLARSVRMPDGSHSRALGTPIEYNVDRVRDYAERGWTNVVYTARPWSDVEIIREWLKVHDIPIVNVVCGKLLFRWLIDDRVQNELDSGFDPGMPGD